MSSNVSASFASSFAGIAPSTRHLPFVNGKKPAVLAFENEKHIASGGSFTSALQSVTNKDIGWVNPIKGIFNCFRIVLFPPSAPIRYFVHIETTFPLACFRMELTPSVSSVNRSNSVFLSTEYPKLLIKSINNCSVLDCSSISK